MNREDVRVPCDVDALMSFVYDECAPDERRRVAAHLETCAVCADEVAGLRGARTQLSAWTPPEISLGFQISSASSLTPSPAAVPASTAVAWWRRPTPVWAQAIAATVLFGVGLAMGSRQPAPQTAQASVPRTASPVVGAETLVRETGGATSVTPTETVVTPTDLSRLEATLRSEIARARVAGAQASVPAAPRNDDVMRQVRELLRDSEERQQNAVAVRLAQLARDAEIQRGVDYANLQRTVMQNLGATGAEVRQQREMLNYLVNVSQRGAVR